MSEQDTEKHTIMNKIVSNTCGKLYTPETPPPMMSLQKGAITGAFLVGNNIMTDPFITLLYNVVGFLLRK